MAVGHPSCKRCSFDVRGRIVWGYSVCDASPFFDLRFDCRAACQQEREYENVAFHASKVRA